MDASLETVARRWGCDLFGVADLEQAAREGLETEPADLFEGFLRAVVVGVKLPGAAVETCVDGPTPLYQHAYTQANEWLDRLTYRLAREMETRGYRALPLPASKLLDVERLGGHVSYKALGRLAGLGWQGKSLLLVSPEVGPRFRMGAVLTDMPLEAGKPLPNRCGSCTACAEACPAGAIKNVGTDDRYASRDEALHFDRCAETCLKVFTRRPHIEKPICGVCVRVCPWGRRKEKGATVPASGA
ncbi:MAG: epoxyqueuosine reductase [Deferrisomatales bacterium]